MTTVKGVIDVQSKGTDKAARGLKNVSEQTESIGRAQTRLGQSSASAGRSFSAQASGLGGLVGVYAAAAANVFAITAAFDALGRAAQAEQIVRGTKLLALEIGQSGKTILENVQQITQSQLTLAEAAQNVNIALSAGFNSDQIEELSEVSLKASRALGRNLTDAFQRVVRGASKLEPELLDELGIFTRIDPAVEAYAAKLNIAANSLTNYEKRQAFVNAVIEEGQKKFSAIDTSIDSSQKTFEQLRVALTELALEFGALVANVLTPLASFFKDNLGNALLLFGGILGLVFGRAIKSIGAFTAQGVSKLGNFADTLADKAKISEDSLKKLRAAAAEPFKGGTGLKGIGGVKGQDPAQLEQFKSAVAQQTSGQVTSVSELNKVNEAYKKQLNITNKNTKSYQNLKGAIERNNNALKSAGGRATVFTNASNALGKSVKGLSVAFRGLAASVNFLFMGIAVAQLVGTLFDRDFLGEIREAITGASNAFKNLSQGVTSATVAASGGSEALKSSLIAAGATDKDLENVADSLKEISEEVLETQTKLKNMENVLRGADFAGIEEGMEGILAIPPMLAEAGIETTKLAAAESLLREERKKGDDADKQRIVLLENTVLGLTKFGDRIGVVGAISKELALSGEKVIEVLKGQGEGLTNLTGGASIAGKTFDKLNKAEQKTIMTGTLLLNTLDKAEEAFKRGAASSETLSKQLGGARKALDEQTEAQIRLNGEFGGEGDLITASKQRVAELEKATRELKKQEGIGKALTGTFGKFGAALDKAVQDGLVGLNGVAQDSRDVAKNQVNFLLTAAGLQGENVEKINEALELQKKGKDIDSIQVQLLTNRTRSLKAISGIVLTLPQEIKKEEDAQKKVSLQLSNQLLTLNKQIELSKAQNALSLQKAQQETRAAVGGAQVKNLQLQLNINEEIANQQERQVKHELDLLKIRNQQLNRLEQIDEIQANRATAAAQAARERGIANQQSVISDFKAFPNLRSLEELQVEQRKLIDLELQNQLAIIDAKEEQANRETARQMEAVMRQEEIFNKQIQSNEEQRKALLQNQQIETQIRQQEQALEIQKIADNKSNLEGQLTVVAKQKDIADAKIQADKLAFDEQNRLETQRIDALETQKTLVDGLREALGGKSAFVQAIDAFLEKEKGIGLGENILNQSFAEIDAGIGRLRNNQAGNAQLRTDIIGARQSAADLQSGGQANLLNEQIARTQQLLDLTAQGQVLENQLAQKKNEGQVAELDQEREKIEEKLSGLDTELELINETFRAKQEGYDAERDAAKQAGEERLRQLQREADTLGDLGNAVIGNINEGVGNAFQTAFDNLASGKKVTDGLGDILRNTFESVRKTVLEETLIKPLQENIKSGLGGLFGFGDTQKGADNAEVVGGALKVTEVGNQGTIKNFANEANNAGKTFKDTLVDGFGAAKEKGSDFFSSITNSFGNLGSSIGSIFSSIGGSLGGLFGGGSSSGGSGILGSLFSGVTSMFGGGSAGASLGNPAMDPMFMAFANGGLVRKFAAGGMQRDRVPAMLEPGEFVVRKPAVQAAGGMGAMQQLNATGQMGGPPVSINVTNEGQPKEAEQQGPPKFDGDKMVVDIVLRDLRTNGPIRRAMRGGEAG